jgi:hypothetical protein
MTTRVQGLGRPAARRIIERWAEGILLPDVVLPWDDEEFADCTVGNILADPARFIGATMADPLEGVEYGRCKAKVLQRSDGSIWIHSFAHGRTVYELKRDAKALEAMLAAITDDDELVAEFARLALDTDMNEADEERIRCAVAARAKVGRKVVDRAIRAARAKRNAEAAEAERHRQAAERHDPRPQIEAPLPDAEWLPQMEAINDVLKASTADEPPMRDGEGFVVEVRVRRAPSMHGLASAGSNGEQTDGTPSLPPPEYPLLTRLDEVELAEQIERYIDYVDSKTGRSVHLATPFVKHFVKRSDDVLPTVWGVATLPLVLPDGGVLDGSGLDRERGLVFRIPTAIRRLVPNTEYCESHEVGWAMQFLMNVWLCDVAADYAGKCVILAAAMTILERLVLRERPAFFVDAGQRGGGKTTACNMISVAALGRSAAAAAWSESEEERRKSLLANLIEGVPLICWDNIKRGTTVSCPSIEKALTAEEYSDRVLGFSERRTVSPAAVQMFTGNNISPRGDLASRSLRVRLMVDRPDPENRPFRHPDPIQWTKANRGKILNAIYTILLGNPRLYESRPAPAETRFKAWYHLVGSAIENAAAQHLASERGMFAFIDKDCVRPGKISFKTMFLAGEANEEQSSSLRIVVDTMRKMALWDDRKPDRRLCWRIKSSECRV